MKNIKLKKVNQTKSINQSINQLIRFRITNFCLPLQPDTDTFAFFWFQTWFCNRLNNFRIIFSNVIFIAHKLSISNGNSLLIYFVPKHWYFWVSSFLIIKRPAFSNIPWVSYKINSSFKTICSTRDYSKLDKTNSDGITTSTAESVTKNICFINVLI